MTIDQISVFVENKAGRLAEITRFLADADVDLRAMSIADTTDYGILRLIVDKPAQAMDALRQKGCVVSVTPVLAVMIPDTPGGLASVLQLLSTHGVDVEYLYAFVTRRVNSAYVILRVGDNALTEAILREGGISVADPGGIHTD